MHNVRDETIGIKGTFLINSYDLRVMGTTHFINYLLPEYREYHIRYTWEGYSFVLSIAFLNKSFFGENKHMSYHGDNFSHIRCLSEF